MKKLLFSFIFILAVQLCTAGTADKIFSNFSKEQNADVVSVGNFMMSFIKPFASDLKDINSIKILSLDDCSVAVKEKFAKQISKLKNDGYETLVRSNDEEGDSHIMLKIKNNVIEELLIITTGNNPAFIRIKGKLKQSDIETLANKK